MSLTQLQEYDRQQFLERLTKSCLTQLETKGVTQLPELRQDGVTLGQVAKYLGKKGLLVRQPSNSDDGKVYVAKSLEALGIKLIEQVS